MDELIEGPQAPTVPTSYFWIALAGSPIAAVATVAAGAAAVAALGCGDTVVSTGVGAVAVSANMLLCGEHGVVIPLVPLAVLYGWLLSYDPALRRMSAPRRTRWVLGGLVMSAVVVMTALAVVLLIAFRGDFLQLGVA